ncbi:U-box domain-containing protein 28-like [Cornus florida]|uniref:U-box domain-containing protein 28-like n=1 Tax=Cornus florida TaxID=4283 RepID=UPI00289FFCD4|nr:U-box domain-containing protein 28-like [Cornus florida]
MVMDKNQLFVTVPSFFKCPISMDVMRSPVSLCTGVTYDRTSIQTWLDSGHNTCPATMQVLDTTDFVPNLTLRRLIHLWSDQPPESDPSFKLPPPISKQEVFQSIRNIDNHADDRLISLRKIIGFAKYSDENRKFLATMDGFLPTMIGVLSNANEIEVRESIITVLDLILSEDGVKEQLKRLILKSNQNSLSQFVSTLQNGNLRSKIESARVLESIAFDAESQRSIAENQGLLNELYRLISSETDRTVIEAGLSVLIAVSTSRPVKKELVRFGIVRTVGRILSGSDTVVPVIEKALKLLEILSTCTEGRTAICDDETCVPAIVHRLMKASTAATEHGIVVLWSVCYLSRDRTAQEAVMKINGPTKVLVVMQSNCSASVRQMCGDLVKVFRVNSKSCLASYDTKTTHIMPY